MLTKKIFLLCVWCLGICFGLNFKNSQTLCSGIIEENHLNIPVGATAGGLSKAEFDQILDSVEKIYTPIAKAKGGSLQIYRMWTDGTVNASANRFGGNWMVNMYGGLARHPAITPEGFALVACHEVGHHIGGVPKTNDGWFNSWASNEGESDYFAVLKCLRKVFSNDDNMAWVKNNNLDPYLVNECSQSFPTPEEQAMCARIAMAGISTTQLFKEVRKETTEPQFSTPDPLVVTETQDLHPGTQCRLDTYFQGSICSVNASVDLTDRDYRDGACSAADGFLKGNRPHCWFKP